MKNVIITGCSSGIGAGAVRFLVNEAHCRVMGIARSAEKLDLLASEFNGAQGIFIPQVFDLSNIDRYDELVKEIQKHFSEIHVLINNAGKLIYRDFESITLQELQQMMTTNFTAPFFLIQQLLPLFSSPSHIVNISSMGGVQGSVKFSGLSAYSASKAALANLTECLAAELSEKQIFVNAIAPGAVQTEMLTNAFPGYKAPVLPAEMGAYVAQFGLNGHTLFNGKILPVSLSTP
jgi:NAD(P)-dependent dehydrogenase (short-subunit alcohol dehydrogenase family)